MYTQATTFREAKLTAVVINAETSNRSDMWTRAGEEGPRVLLLSPEQLISKRLEKLVNDSVFRRRVCLLAVDEVHLLDSWGSSFRKSYQQITYMRARFESSLVAIAMTATLLPGDQTDRVCEFVGLRGYHTVRRSNRRPEIQLLFRVLSHGIENWEFSDLRWVIEGMRERKTIIFCTSIRDGFRIFSYLWRQLDSPPTIRHEQLRMYNALNWPDYNLRTRELIRKQGGCRVIIATDILMVGIDFPDINDVVIIGHPPHPNDYLQKIGHAGRDRALVLNPRGIMYVTGHAMKTAYDQMGIERPGRPKAKPKLGQQKKHKTKKRKPKKCKTSLMSKPMAELITSGCKTAMLDRMYQNPPLKLTECDCSGCTPEPETKKHPPKRRAKGNVYSLTKEMRESATGRFVTLRRKIFIKEVQSALTDPFFVLPRVLPDELIVDIVDALLQLDWDVLNMLVRNDEIAKDHVVEIWTVALELKETYRQQLKQEADEKAARKMYVLLLCSVCIVLTAPNVTAASQKSGNKNRWTLVFEIRGMCCHLHSMVFLTGFSLPRSEEDTKPKRRRVQPTKRLPPLTIPGEAGERAGNVTSWSDTLPLPRTAAMTDLLLKVPRMLPHHPQLSPPLWNRKNPLL